MSKKTFVIFGLLVVFLAVLIPWVAFRSNGDAATGAQDVPAGLKEGQSLFQTNCGTCHTLYAAGTDGNFGPDLDEKLAKSGLPEGPNAQQTIDATENLVRETIEKGADNPTTPGRMPGGILNEQQAEVVAEFVARTAGEG
jgi:mono/diheme cytochrome c family protein